MADVYFTFEDTSPLLKYSKGQWRAGKSNGDGFYDQYSDGSFMVTDRMGAKVELSFFGSEITLFGALRDNHGTYRVLVDGVEGTANSNGKSANALFKQPLYRYNTTSSQPQARHTIQLENTGADGVFLDLDYVTLKSTIGKAGDVVHTRTVQDSVSSGESYFQYSPSQDWNTKLPESNWYHGGTGHITNVANASATLIFRGHAVAIYGSTGPNFSQYSASIDGQTPEVFSAQREGPERAQQLLYLATGLPSGEHTVKLTSLATDTGPQSFSIDYANIYLAAAPGGQESFETSPTVNPPGNSKQQVGLIFGISFLGGIVFLGLAVLLVMFLHRRFGLFPFLSKNSSRILSWRRHPPPPLSEKGSSLPSDLTFTPISTQYASSLSAWSVAHYNSSMAGTEGRRTPAPSTSGWSRSTRSTRTNGTYARGKRRVKKEYMLPPIEVDSDVESGKSIPIEGPSQLRTPAAVYSRERITQ